MLLASCGVFVIDLVSKSLVSSGMELGSTIPVIPGAFDLTYVQNTGAAWGIMADKQFILQILTGLLIAGLTFYAVHNRKKLVKLEFLSIGLILGGGLGNFVGRLFSGYVVDFLNIHIIPVFNAADIGITVGCFLLVYSTIMAAKEEE